MKMEEKYRRRIALILCLSFILPNIMFTVPSKVSAATAYVLEVPAVVTSTTLNVREDAGTTAEKIGSITKDTKVTIIGQKVTNGEIWYKIKTTVDKKTITGYSSSVYLQIVPESGFFGSVDATSVTMKKQPSANSDSVSLSNGTKLTLPRNREIWIISEATQNGVKWFYIRITSGGKRYYGYVPAASVRLTGTKVSSQATPTPTLTPTPTQPQVSGSINLDALVTSTTLNVRKTPGTSGALITTFKIGQRVTILSEQMAGVDKWYHITATIEGKKITGYVHSDYIEIEVGSGFYAVVKPTAVTYKVSAGNASKNQTYDSGKSITASKGTYVWVSKEETKDQDKWFRISKHADGKVYYGYVKANDLTIVGKKKPQTSTPTLAPTPTVKPTQAPTQTPTQAPSGHVVNLSAAVTSTTLNIRKTPGTSGALLTTVKNGQQVMVLSEKMVGTEKWYEITATVGSKKITGYVLSDYVKIDVGSGFYATVKPTTVTYKTSASSSSKNQTDASGKVITASKGTYVWVSKEETSSATKWFRISKHADGKVYYGYVKANDLMIIGKKKPQTSKPTQAPTPTVKPTQAPTQTPSGHVINLGAAVTSTTLNIRKTPGTSGALLTTVKNGQRVTILSEEMVGTEKWYEITATVGTKKVTGYVLSDYVKIDVGSGFYATVKPTTVTYKASASSSSKNQTDASGKAITATKGTYVWVSKEETKSGIKWFRISKHADGKVYYGYVKANDLLLIGKTKPTIVTPVPTPIPTPVPTLAPTVTPTTVNILAYVSATSLNLREKAGTSSKVLATMSQNTQLTVLSQITMENEIWYQVRTSMNGKELTGFVYSPYVKLSLSNKASAKSVTSGAIVYQSSSTSSTVITKLEKNQQVNVTAEQTSYGVKWFRIECKQGSKVVKGYVQASMLVLTGNKPAFSIEGLVTPAPTMTATPTPIVTPKPTATPTPPGEVYNQSAVIKDANSLGVRETASFAASFIKDSNGYPIMLSTGMPITAIKSTYAENIMWMMISFDYNGKSYQGFINKAYVELTGTVVPGNPVPTAAPSVDFESMLTQQGFPESYKPYLRELHEQYPNWQFEAYHTNLTWDEVIRGENIVGKNLITNSRGIEWKSLEPGAYNYATDSFVVYDGSYWVTASKDAISYYMDPRNFLTANTIFQFEVLTYKPEFQSLAGVENILKYTPLHNAYYSYTDANGVRQTISYAETFIKAAEYSNVSPYHLASRVKQEVVTGKNSLSSSVSGTVKGFEGYYNFYNIGAYHSTAPGGAIANGLKYAKYGSKNATFNKTAMIPWNNRYRAIVGGGYIIGNSYINRGQDTIYLQKFNVTPNSTYSHQYMANVEAAASEAKKVFAGYSHVDELPIVFSIPVYKNMPTNAVARPATAYNPNNYLKTLKVTDASGKTLSLTPSFSILSTTDYAIVLDGSHNSVTISASCVNSKATVSGTGKYTLVDGINPIELTVTAQNGKQRKYMVTIVKDN